MYVFSGIEMFESDFHELIDQYKLKKKNNSHYIFEYIKENLHLSVLDLSIITGREPKLIRTYMRDLGINLNKHNIKSKPRDQGITTRIPDIDFPANWLDREWLNRATLVMGARKIARLVNVSFQRVSIVIKQYGLEGNAKIRDLPRHQFKNHAWLHYHYNILHYSKKRCSELANVSYRTMNDWFAQFKIANRKALFRLPQRLIWLENYWNDLKKSKHFKFVVLYEHKIRITLKNNKVIQLLFKRPKGLRLGQNDLIIQKSRFKADRIPRILPTFTVTGFVKNTGLHSGFSRATFDSVGQVEQHLAIMDLAKHINKHRFAGYRYPQTIVDGAKTSLWLFYEELKGNSESKFTDFAVEHPIYVLSLHFMRPRYLNILTIKERDTFKILYRLKKRLQLNIDYHGYLRTFLSFGSEIFNYDNLPIDPICPAHLAVYFGLTNYSSRIVDLYPSVEYALAFDLAGLIYTYINNKYFDVGMCAGLYQMMRIKPRTVISFNDSDILLNAPFGMINNNIKIKAVRIGELKKYEKSYAIIGVHPIMSVRQNSNKPSITIIAYY